MHNPPVSNNGKPHNPRCKPGLTDRFGNLDSIEKLIAGDDSQTGKELQVQSLISGDKRETT